MARDIGSDAVSRCAELEKAMAVNEEALRCKSESLHALRTYLTSHAERLPRHVRLHLRAADGDVPHTRAEMQQVRIGTSHAVQPQASM